MGDSTHVFNKIATVVGWATVHMYSIRLYGGWMGDSTHVFNKVCYGGWMGDSTHVFNKVVTEVGWATVHMYSIRLLRRLDGQQCTCIQ